MTDLSKLLGYDFEPDDRQGELRKPCGAKQASPPGAHVYLGRRRLLRADYDALEDVARQFNQPVEVFQEVPSAIPGPSIGRCFLTNGNGRITRLNTNGLNIATHDGTLTIPKALTQLEGLYVFECNLKDLHLPDTLTEMTRLNCSENHLYKIDIPGTYTQLEHIHCATNQLETLELPDTLVRLTSVDANDNKLTALEISDKLTELREANVCDNPLITLNVPRKTCAHVLRTKLPFLKKAKYILEGYFG